MIDWTRGYTSRFTAYEVDGSTWAETAVIGRVASADVDRTASGLLESGSLSITVDVLGGFQERYVRICMDAEQDGRTERVDVATLLCASEGGTANHGVDFLDVQGRSVLYPASVRKVHDLGNDPYAPMGCDGAAYAGALLSKCVAAPVHVDCGFTLGTSIVHDLSDSYLDAAWAVLGAGNCTVQIDGRGEVHVIEMPSEPDPEVGAVTASSLMPGIEHGSDYSSIPNRYYAASGSTATVAVNDDPNSPTSTVSRGYFVDFRDESPKPVGGETLAEYARRKLAEKSVAKDTRKYKREFRPGVYVGSLLDVSMGGEPVVTRVERQSLAIGHGIVVTEESSREVATWQA